VVNCDLKIPIWTGTTGLMSLELLVGFYFLIHLKKLNKANAFGSALRKSPVTSWAVICLWAADRFSLFAISSNGNDHLTWPVSAEDLQKLTIFNGKFISITIKQNKANLIWESGGVTSDDEYCFILEIRVCSPGTRCILLFWWFSCSVSLITKCLDMYLFFWLRGGGAVICYGFLLLFLNL